MTLRWHRAHKLSMENGESPTGVNAPWEHTDITSFNGRSRSEKLSASIEVLVTSTESLMLRSCNKLHCSCLEWIASAFSKYCRYNATCFILTCYEDKLLRMKDWKDVIYWLTGKDGSCELNIGIKKNCGLYEASKPSRISSLFREKFKT